MCGITGFIDFTHRTSTEILNRMISTLGHRGPDDHGAVFYPLDVANLGLGHTRLSIIDLSQLGHQPMNYMNYTIVLNGEIYNYNEIRNELIEMGHQFRSHSDTEVILASFVEWNIAAVHKFIGMYSFAIFDSERHKLWICRDRAGVKPLFYYWKDGLFLFSSELKAFHKHPRFEKRINDTSLFKFIQFSYVPGPETIFENTFKLNPGTWLEFDLREGEIRFHNYWNLLDYFEKPLLQIGYEEACRETEKLVLNASQYRMVADVPVGVFLSGGYDSTLISSLLQTNMTRKLKTFTIGFPDGIDESKHAGRVAEILGTEHTLYNCTFKDAKLIIPDLVYYYDEPLADISTIPTILVSRLARQDVKVALSADGGDELFAGYFHYYSILRRFNQIQSVPEIMYPLLSWLLNHSSRNIPDSLFHLKHKMEGSSKAFQLDKSSQLTEILKYARTLSNTFNKKLFRHFNSKENIWKPEDFTNLTEIQDQLLYIDYTMSLRDCLLVKVDRGTMSTSLEGREPLMDHRLAEFAAQLPFCFKYDGKTFKRILRDITHKYIDKSIMDRPKVGFDLPVFHWLKSDLAFLIKDHLSPSEVIKSGYFNEDYVNQLVKKFLNDKLLYKPIIWRLLIFQMWHKHWME